MTDTQKKVQKIAMRKELQSMIDDDSLHKFIAFLQAKSFTKGIVFGCVLTFVVFFILLKMGG